MSISIRQRFVSATRRPHADMEPEALEWFGLDNLCRSAKAWNRLRYRRKWSRHRHLYREHFADLVSENGPLVFLPRRASDRVRSELSYGRRKRAYRIADDEVYRVVDASETIAMQGRRGTVCFVESSDCFHYGSRDCTSPRYQLMLAYVSPCRTDFADRYMSRIEYPGKPDDSRLRALVLGHENEDQG